MLIGAKINTKDYEIGYLQGTGDEVDMLEQLSVGDGHFWAKFFAQFWFGESLMIHWLKINKDGDNSKMEYMQKQINRMVLNNWIA